MFRRVINVQWIVKMAKCTMSPANARSVKWTLGRLKNDELQITNDKWMKKILLLMLAVMTLAACKNKETTHGDVHEFDHIYACPMHPEVTGKEGDKCPKCGMMLE